MDIDQVINEITPGGSEIILNSEQEKMMVWMRLALEYTQRLLKLTKAKNKKVLNSADTLTDVV